MKCKNPNGCVGDVDVTTRVGLNHFGRFGFACSACGLCHEASTGEIARGHCSAAPVAFLRDGEIVWEPISILTQRVFVLFCSKEDLEWLKWKGLEP